MVPQSHKSRPVGRAVSADHERGGRISSSAPFRGCGEGEGAHPQLAIPEPDISLLISLTLVGVLIVCLLAWTRHRHQVGEISENERHWAEVRRLIGTLCGPCGMENFPGCVLTTAYRAPDQSVANRVRDYLLENGLGWSEVDVHIKDGKWNVSAITGSTVVTPTLCDTWIKEMRYVCEELGCSLEHFGAPPDGGGGSGVLAFA